MPKYKLKVRKTIFMEAIVEMDSEEFPTEMEADDYVRRRLDSIPFVQDCDHYRVWDIDGIKTSRIIK